MMLRPRALARYRSSLVSVLLTAAVMASVATSAAAQRQFELLRKRGLPADAHARVDQQPVQARLTNVVRDIMLR